MLDVSLNSLNLFGKISFIASKALEPAMQPPDCKWVLFLSDKYFPLQCQKVFPSQSYNSFNLTLRIFFMLKSHSELFTDFHKLKYSKATLILLIFTQVLVIGFTFNTKLVTGHSPHISTTFLV